MGRRNPKEGRSAWRCRSPLRPTGRMRLGGAIRPSCRPGRSLSPAHVGATASVRGELSDLWRAQDVAAADARRATGRALHGGASDTRHGLARRDPLQIDPDHEHRQSGPLPARLRQSAFQGPATECVLGIQLHLVGDMVRLRLCRIRHRRTCPCSAQHRNDGGSRLIVGWQASRTAHAYLVLVAHRNASGEGRGLGGARSTGALPDC